MTSTYDPGHPTAVITGASKGLGYQLARALSMQGWRLVVDARSADALREATDHLGADVTAIAGDVTDPAHRADVRDLIDAFGRLDLLVNNASTIGMSPMPTLADAQVSTLRTIYETNVIAPLALTRTLLPYLLTAGGTVVNISSDAAVEPYEGWG
ncbi:MAG: SDR family oxidoreductase, partial [Nocardioidaceae bacterium]